MNRRLQLRARRGSRQKPIHPLPGRRVIWCKTVISHSDGTAPRGSGWQVRANPDAGQSVWRFDGALLRHAIKERYRLQLIYTDRDGNRSDRIVWPLLIAFLDRTRYLFGWCEAKEDYRRFKTERVEELRVLGQKYPGRRQALLKGWEEATAHRMQG